MLHWSTFVNVRTQTINITYHKGNHWNLRTTLKKFIIEAQYNLYGKVEMAVIINLNRKRKAKKRIEKEKEASENRIKFGRTKKERLLIKQKTELEERRLNGHQLEKI